MTDAITRRITPLTLSWAVLAYAVVHAASGLAIIWWYPSPTFGDTAFRLRDVTASTMQLVAIGALVMVLAEFLSTLRNHILPALKR
ncbi:MAG TPA: hypothetical protein VII84_05610 [Acidimicrobiales bacterium]|jgi:hypothetical protein